MSILEVIADQRRKFLDGLDANEGDINLDIFEDFYPDKGHFIFELLQNAEDAEATEATFALTQNQCTFEHNGKRKFTEDDVRSITGIHNSTKSKSIDQIGKFGIGFKSVFVYTLTPSVYSGQFAFQILRLVLPEQLDIDPSIGDRTRFVLPFNNPEKPIQNAYKEIKMGLEEPPETTLLFLSNLKSINWEINGRFAGEFLRINHSEHHIEVQKIVSGKMESSFHFLRFSNDIEDLGKQHVAIAFELDFLPNVARFNVNKPLHEQMKIIPAKRGLVAVFFPAEKEESKLRFHLHGPFMPELSRASIKDTPVNEPLFNQLAKLTASSLHILRDLNLLTGGFLGVLPNAKDEIPKRYQPIYKAIIAEMNDKQLTPTYTKNHEPARYLLQAKASLKALLSEDDLKFLVDYKVNPFKWAIGAKQKNSNVDNFLINLAITKWDLESFVHVLEEMTSNTSNVSTNYSNNSNITNSEFMNWFANKSDEWHEDLYALLDTELISGLEYHQKLAIERLKNLKIIRLSNGEYKTGNECYFPSNNTKYDELLPIVAIGVYSSGKNKDNAKHFLKKIGVREFGEAEQIEMILKERYTHESLKPNMNAFYRFIMFLEREPQHAKIFADYHIFRRIDEKWVVPRQIYLDAPFLDTGLSAFYDTRDEEPKRMALDQSYYQKCGIPIDRIVKFAKNVGAQTYLEIKKVSCTLNPDASKLVWGSAGNWTENSINLDYTIKGLENIINNKDEALSSLVWRTLCSDPKPNWITAQCKKNARQQIRRAPSQLICIVRDAAWVPQKDGRFVRPCEASRDLLPEGFQFNHSHEWGKAVHFEEEILQKSEERKKQFAAAVDLGFSDQKSLEDGKWFARLTEQERQDFIYEHQSRHETKLPNQKPANPELRSKRVSEIADDAPERLTEMKNRSVSINRDAVKKEAEQYLRQQYTNSDEQMICQVCRMQMPFKLDNGTYYFEKVEFLDMNKHHYQNYLALCPTHAAMFKHANGSRDMLKNMVIMTKNNEIEVVLAQKDDHIYFTDAQILDLKAVIKSDQQDDE